MTKRIRQSEKKTNRIAVGCRTMSHMQRRQKIPRRQPVTVAHARGGSRRCHQPVRNHVLPTPHRLKRHCTFNAVTQVESCSRDPNKDPSFGFEFYEFLGGSPAARLDHDGWAWSPILASSPWHPSGPAADAYDDAIGPSGGPGPTPPATPTFNPAPSPCTGNNMYLWYMRELRELNSWIGKLPACPCTIRCVKKNCDASALVVGGGIYKCNPDPSSWSFSDMSGVFGVTQAWGNYHPGGHYELRSSGCGHGTQCVYDAQGFLINDPPGAGTADRVSPNCSTGEHGSADVAAYDCAKTLDRARNTSIYTNYYFRVRPVNSGKKCVDPSRPAGPFGMLIGIGTHVM
ncbi:hypothetical protein Pla52n_70840 [Stieleria varia]|uniref:Uncharacterized protein n=1 Tax=Stieleria varia TaxID=2528005 RepID=A0A5C5ZIP8_9BACT|nr:hypothetical protein Pla52n_70840 [Stieleria varia]